MRNELFNLISFLVTKEKKKNLTENKIPKYFQECILRYLQVKMSAYLKFALKYLRLQKKMGGVYKKKWQNIGSC